MSDVCTHDVTALLIEWTRGDSAAIDKLLPLVNGELRRLARRQIAGERPGGSSGRSVHFFAMAARLMRRVLVDFARASKNQKRGGAMHRVTFHQDLPVVGETSEDLIAIGGTHTLRDRKDDALAAFGREYERKAQLVELRFFGGLSVEETAEVLKISPETVMRDWKFAKGWLMRELSRTQARNL